MKKGFVKHTAFTWIAIPMLLGVIALPLFAQSFSVADKEQEGSDTRAQQLTPPSQQEIETQPRKRLRFRDGPVCMCADGLSENDILESQKRNRKKLEIIENNEGRQP